MTTAVLRAEAIVAGYEPDLPILNGASFEVRDREIVALLGPNGAGKSTLIKAIAGLVPISSGVVTLAGEEITRLPAHVLIRRGLGFVPQTENVFTTMSIDDNLKLAAAVLEKPRRGPRIAAMYAMFPALAARRHLAAGRLSGGQRQMLAIARALLVEPKVLMLDEPSAGLSPKVAAEVFENLLKIRASGVAIALVEQSVRAALSIADRAYILAEGRNRHEGAAADLCDDPVIARLYLGGDPTAARANP
ncbi:MAG TPA: ABC transporter ATP-binding protein [Candidatus Binatia bacterium]|nr:ABC transporter ATP-binding protein [Candidatus Binatia bacterium]